MQNFVLVALLVLMAGGAQAAPLDPNAFSSLGVLTPSSTVTIDTDALTVSVDGSIALLGVEQSQGVGNPSVAVFSFDQVSLPSTVSVSIQGSRPLAILSRGDFLLATELSVEGLGYGFGEGPGGINLPGDQYPSFGGTFGGLGGWTRDELLNPEALTYGDLLTTLEGGAAGGQGRSTQTGNSAIPGGHGGGAIELGAVGIITLEGSAVLANQPATLVNGRGARAPGGSLEERRASIMPGSGAGGGILVHAARVVADPAVRLDASGGDGRFEVTIGSTSEGGYRGAGGGGGGRVTLLADSFELSDFSSGLLDVTGGAGGTSLANPLNDRLFVGEAGESGQAVMNVGAVLVSAGESLALSQNRFGSALFDLESLNVSAGGAVSVASSEYSVSNLVGAGSFEMIQSSLNVGINGSDSTFEGLLAGTGSIAKSGTGTFTLTGENTFLGLTQIQAGTLDTSAASTPAAIQNEAELIFRQEVYGNHAAGLSGTGNLRKLGSGTLALDGSYQQTGLFSVEEGILALNSGTLTDGDLAVAQAARFENHGGLAQVGGVQNGGTIEGSLQALGVVDNLATGEIRLAQGDSFLSLGLSPSQNAGLIDSVGASVEFEGALFNSAPTGRIYGRNAALRFNGGLTNQGSLALSFGTSDIYGSVANQVTGNIVVSGLSSASFLGGVTNEGNIQTGAGSTSVFFGTVTGSGAFNGTGQILMEGGFEPGSSPAEVYFGGDLLLGVANTLTIELGGTTPGTEHDKLIIANALSLAGVLDVQLFGGYQPIGGDTFNIFDAASISGMFTQLLLPGLSTGLEWDTSSLQTAGVIQVIPEPGIALLLGLGLTALAVRRRA